MKLLHVAGAALMSACLLIGQTSCSSMTNTGKGAFLSAAAAVLAWVLAWALLSAAAREQA